jgi:hypothetical protein
MPSTPSAEHFVTLFDSAFLPQALALAQSLEHQCPDATLWAVCVDQKLLQSFASLKPRNVRTIDVRDIEDENLLRAKATRTAREYCWTLASFSFDAVFARCPQASRVTYVDADLFFFDNAAVVFQELDSSGASVLITEHNFDPRYDRSETVGRFCVQFLAMDRSEEARGVRRWWQERVLEWCYDRVEPGRFGDQKYLDLWPGLFGERIHILQRRELALAPWNVRMEAHKSGGRLQPCFYHFHSFRVVGERRVRLVEGGYAIPSAARQLYSHYVSAIGGVLRQMRSAGLDVPVQAIPARAFPRARHLAKKGLGRADLFARLPGAP